VPSGGELPHGGGKVEFDGRGLPRETGGRKKNTLPGGDLFAAKDGPIGYGIHLTTRQTKGTRTVYSGAQRLGGSAPATSQELSRKDRKKGGRRPFCAFSPGNGSGKHQGAKGLGREELGVEENELTPGRRGKGKYHPANHLWVGPLRWERKTGTSIGTKGVLPGIPM